MTDQDNDFVFMTSFLWLHFYDIGTKMTLYWKRRLCNNVYIFSTLCITAEIYCTLTLTPLFIVSTIMLVLRAFLEPPHSKKFRYKMFGRIEQ